MSNDTLKDLCNHLLSTQIKYNLTAFIYFGEADPDEIQAVKKATPQNAVLIYFHPPAPDFEEQFDPTTLTATASLTPDLAFINDLLFTITCLKFKQTNFSANQMASQKYSQQIEITKEAAQSTLQGMYHEKKARYLNFRSALHNLRYITDLRSYQNPALSPNIPVIICSAGPSLAGQLELLKAHQDNAYIISLGRVYNQLQEAGITPDFVTEIDPVAHLNWPEPSTTISSSSLIATTTVSPNIAERFEKIIWFNGESIFFKRFMDQLNMHFPDIAFSTTATVTAIDFAIQAGATNICLIGNDFCLADNGSSHISGGVQLLVNAKDTFEIPGNNNENVKTVKGLNIIKLALEDYLSQQKETISLKKIKLFNSTQHGAQIALTTYIPLTEYLKQFSHTAKTTIHFERKTYPPPADNYQQIISSLEDFQHESPQTTIPPEVKAIFHCLQELSDEIYLESSSLSIKDKKEIITILLSDIILDFKHLVSYSTQATCNLLYNQSFRKLSIAKVAESNPQYAQLLDSALLPSEHAEFKFELSPPCGRFIPFTSIIYPDGSKLALNSSNQTMENSARHQVLSHLRHTKTKIKDTGIIFYAPANWLFPVVLSEQHPNAEIMVIDPWPELFNQLINYSLFTHKLPATCTIIAIHQELSDFPHLISQTIKKWQQNNKQIMIFKHPITWQLPEIQSIYNNIVAKLITNS